MTLFLVDRHAAGVERGADPEDGPQRRRLVRDDLRRRARARRATASARRAAASSYLLDGLNAERILIAAEALGIGRAALRRAVAYANERVVFDRPIGKNQGIAFPLAEAHAKLRAAGADDPRGGDAASTPG